MWLYMLVGLSLFFNIFIIFLLVYISRNVDERLYFMYNKLLGVDDRLYVMYNKLFGLSSLLEKLRKD